MPKWSKQFRNTFWKMQSRPISTASITCVFFPLHSRHPSWKWLMHGPKVGYLYEHGFLTRCSPWSVRDRLIKFSSFASFFHLQFYFCHDHQTTSLLPLHTTSPTILLCHHLHSLHNYKTCFLLPSSASLHKPEPHTQRACLVSSIFRTVYYSYKDCYVLLPCFPFVSVLSSLDPCFLQVIWLLPAKKRDIVRIQCNSDLMVCVDTSLSGLSSSFLLCSGCCCIFLNHCYSQAK